ncbi:hypothetical protein N7490_011795 [Penicillium lividum]|nr:hypothetical protein N7490_011795 [Penicillium lividum]
MQDMLVVKNAADLISDPSKGWKDPLRTFEMCALPEEEEKSVWYAGMCSMCNTECRLQIAVIDGKVTFIMIRWINLSTGLIPDDI